MTESEYRQPGTCQVGNRYYLMSERNGVRQKFSEVIFVSYRPHPGEIVVNDGLGPRVVHRLYLYQKYESTCRSSGTFDRLDESGG